MSPKRRHFRTFVVLGVVCLVLVGGRAWAGGSPWYVAARFGESSAEAQFGAVHPKFVDDEAGTAAVELGYQVNEYLSVEGGFHDLGSHAAFGSPCRQSDVACIERLWTLGLCAEPGCAELLAPAEAELSGFSVALVPGVPLGDRLSLRGKVGIMAWDGDVVVPGFDLSERFSGEELLTGVGLEYSFPGGLGILLQHEELDLDVGTTSLGLSWRF